MRIVKRQALVTGVALLLALAGGGPAHAATAADLTHAARGLPGASGAYVYDVTSGVPLLNRRGGVPRILASNTKLFTAAATLDRFGADERLITSIWTNGTLVNGALDGDVYLRGGGDPLFGSADYVSKYFGSGATVEQLAQQVRAAGITSISGRVFGDESMFDDRRGTAPYGFSPSGEIGGQLGALIFNRGLAGGGFQNDPPRFAAQRMRLALKAAGVAVAGSTGVGPAPTDARVIAYVESLPFWRLVRLMDKPSNNYLAEMLVKDLALPPDAVRGGSDGGGGAAPGASADPVLTTAPAATTRAGDDAARTFAATLGARVTLSDGSGLSRGDRAAPSDVVNLLRGMSGRAVFTQFDQSLPIPGVDGTLVNRMRGSDASKRCQAKTGTLSNVSALSGYCTTASGRLIAFSILNNRVWPPAARAAQDRIVKTIADLD